MLNRAVPLYKVTFWPLVGLNILSPDQDVVSVASVNLLAFAAKAVHKFKRLWFNQGGESQGCRVVAGRL